MLEILLAIGVALAILAMAGKPRKGRKMGKYIRGDIDEELGVGALTTKTVINAAFDSVVNERTLVSSIVALWSMEAHTGGEGPIVVGVNHSDYTAAEVQEVLDATGSWDEGDLVAQEIAGRKIRQIGVFQGVAALETLNDGKPIKTKLNWILLQGQTLDVWAYNRDAATLTTGTSIKVDGHANLWPQ